MPVSMFETDAPHGEASRLVAFAHNRIDRQSEYRSEDDLPNAIGQETTRYFAIAGDRLIMRVNGTRPEGLLSRSEIEALAPDMAEAILLGRHADGAAMIAVPVGTMPDDLPEAYKALDGRSVYRQQLLETETLGAYAQANSLAQWSRTHRFCGRCGEKTLPEAGGYRRKCAGCSAPSFPRTDPVVIMLVIDTASDRCLMGRSPHFPEKMYSCLAGFVEPGETMEDAVRRETFEEAGVRVGRVRYHASQPWPMPHSLMIGVYGEAESLEIARDTTELEDCRWFTRHETIEMLKTSLGDYGETPPPGAIAHRLMRDWIDWKR